MATIRETLTLPILAEAQIVAGQAGLDAFLQGAHILDTPDAWLQEDSPGVLLLTTGLGLRHNPELQAELIPRLVERGFAGLMLATGFYFQQIPGVIQETADTFNFPVIEIPGPTSLTAIAKAISESLVNRHYALWQESAQIHKRLTKLMLQGGDLNDLVRTLTELLDCSVCIEDTSFYIVAAAEIGVVDEARRSSVQQGRTSTEMAQQLLKVGVYKKLLQQMEPIHLEPLPDLGMNQERVIAPIVIDREVYGYLWIIINDRPLTDLNRLTIEHGMTAAALIMLKEKAAREAQNVLSGDFFERLLQSSGNRQTLARQAGQLDYRLDHPHQVLLIYGVPNNAGNFQPFHDAIKTWLRQRNQRALMLWREDYLALVIESDSTLKGKQLAMALLQDTHHPAWRLLIGVGRTYTPLSDSRSTIRQSYEEAQETVQASLKLGRFEGVVAFDELGLLHWLYHLSPEQRADNAYLQQIVRLAAHDAKYQTELVRTLEAYLEHGYSLVDTAKALHVHRNTLIKRLERIEQLGQLELDQPMLLLNLYAALKSYRLHPA